MKNRSLTQFLGNVVLRLKTMTHIVFIFATLSFASAHATTLIQLDIVTVARDAELIFEGQVIAKDSRWNGNRSRIHTYVTYSINEIISGDYNGSELTLRFAGGEVDGTQMRVAGMVYPALGEHGIYFVESIQQGQIHPLIGWTQGHFKLINGKVRAANNMPVISLDMSSDIESPSQTKISKGVADGVQMKLGAPSLSRDEFIEAIQDALE